MQGILFQSGFCVEHVIRLSLPLSHLKFEPIASVVLKAQRWCHRYLRKESQTLWLNQNMWGIEYRSKMHMIDQTPRMGKARSIYPSLVGGFAQALWLSRSYRN